MGGGEEWLCHTVTPARPTVARTWGVVEVGGQRALFNYDNLDEIVWRTSRRVRQGVMKPKSAAAVRFAQ